ncbi:hypothetical protein DPEC_G00235670 [Dallia pectoralis]|uniref:Uncharacterized protein n=1 Tax=Dallia pectoralis TaxID=75939 RepID=A0ACC2FYK3_DALPE|nr:hypothetical protein DPEC_G00235670 [Dallia pectoralis]
MDSGTLLFYVALCMGRAQGACKLALLPIQFIPLSTLAGVSPLQHYWDLGKSSGSRWHGHLRKVRRAAVLLEPCCVLPLPPPSSSAITPHPEEPCRSATSVHRAKAGGMRLDSVHLSVLVIGVSFACYSPSLNSLQDQAYRSAVVIEGKVQSAAPLNVTAEPYSVSVRVLDVWPRNSGGLEREQLVTVGEFGSEAPCTSVIKNHKYIFFMDPTDKPLVFKASFAPLDASGKNLKKDVGKILCENCETGLVAWFSVVHCECVSSADWIPGTEGFVFDELSGTSIGSFREPR